MRYFSNWFQRFFFLIWNVYIQNVYVIQNFHSAITFIYWKSAKKRTAFVLVSRQVGMSWRGLRSTVRYWWCPHCTDPNSLSGITRTEMRPTHRIRCIKKKKKTHKNTNKPTRIDKQKTQKICGEICNKMFENRLTGQILHFIQNQN